MALRLANIAMAGTSRGNGRTWPRCSWGPLLRLFPEIMLCRAGPG